MPGDWPRKCPWTKKRAYGRVVIDNRGSLEETERQVREIWEREMREAADR